MSGERRKIIRQSSPGIRQEFVIGCKSSPGVRQAFARNSPEFAREFARHSPADGTGLDEKGLRSYHRIKAIWCSCRMIVYILNEWISAFQSFQNMRPVQVLKAMKDIKLAYQGNYRGDAA